MCPEARSPGLNERNYITDAAYNFYKEDNNEKVGKETKKTATRNHSKLNETTVIAHHLDLPRVVSVQTLKDQVFAIEIQCDGLLPSSNNSE